MSTELVRDSEVGQQTTDATFRTAVQTACSVSDDIDYDELYRDLSSQLSRFTTQGSGWTLQGINEFTLHIAQYRPLIGSSFIPSPTFIANKMAVVNPQNKKDQKCFMWAILAALYPADKDTERVGKYKKYENELNWSGLKFPVSLAQIRTFERNNTNLTVNVYQYKPDEDNAIIPIYLTKFTARQKHIDLLLLTENENSHYTWIKSMSRLIAHRTKAHCRTFTCPHCVHAFSTEAAFENHWGDCSKHIRQHIVFPEKDKDDSVSWTSRGKTELSEFVIYADFESYLSPTPQTDPISGKNKIINEHIPSGFCTYTVSRLPHHPHKLYQYSGPD